MFDNIGSKVKSLAQLVFTLGVIIGIVGAAVAGVSAGGFGGVVLFIVILGISIVAAYLSVMMLYAFGDLVENTQRNTEILSYISEVIANVDVNIVEIANGKNAEDGVSPNNRSHTGNNTVSDNTVAKLARIANSMNGNGASKWRCPDCDTANDGTVSICRACGKSRY